MRAKQLDAQTGETAARRAEIVVLDTQPLQEIDGEVLAAGGDVDRVIALAPDLDGVAEEVDVAGMCEVDQDAHDARARMRSQRVGPRMVVRAAGCVPLARPTLRRRAGCAGRNPRRRRSAVGPAERRSSNE